MEEVGTQLAPPLYMYNTIGAGRFSNGHPMAKKRSLPFQGTNFIQHQQQQQYLQRLIPSLDDSRNSWNPKNWEWDSSRLVAKPVDMMEISREHEQQQQHHLPAIVSTNSDVSKKNPVGQREEDERLLLKLGGGLVPGEEPITRPSKRVRSGSPGSGGGGGGGGNYPMCQVDNCKEDLSAAKDYHRRHKVCEVHSKSGKALVGKQMQRFCQQCSRFHPLSEFDEGKRSCRRRLAGHNRRRRKTQPEDVASHLLLAGNDQLIQILNKINSLPMPVDLVSKLPVSASLKTIDQEKPSSEIQNKVNRKTSSSTMDLLGGLSGTSDAPAPNPPENSSQKRNLAIESDKTNSSCRDQTMVLNPPNQPAAEMHSGGERSSTSFQSRGEDSDCQVLDTPLNLQLQLFSSSPEDDSPPKLASSRKYFSSDSSNPMEDRSPSSSPPVVQRLFPTKSSRGRMKPESMSTSGEVTANVKASSVHGGTMSLELFGGPNAGTDNISIQSSPYRAGYTSSSGSDQSPSSLNSDPQDRTGRILFKLFDKDPSHLPGSLRTQLEGNFLQYINSLLQDSGTDFWGTGRFLAHTEKQIASHKDAKESSQESTYEEISTCSFTVCAPSVLGRCFIEIENGFRGTSFPVIIADATLCKELRLLEAEFGEVLNGQSSSMKEVLHFLNELGWLFQRKGADSHYSLTRFKFLLVFSVERDFCALVRTLLGILLKNGSGITDEESYLEMLSGINLLNRAVKRRCKNMVDLLIRYSVLDDKTASRKYIFPPNADGPGGITPLHLAACTSNSDDMVDALTNDPQEIGMLCWNSSIDANGLSPFAYASMRNNNSYNTLVARKLADRIAGQVSVGISNEIELQTSTRNEDHHELSFRVRDREIPKSCSRCATVAAKHPRRIPGSQGLLHRPYIHSMLAIAAVCVCVCLFLRGAPDIGLVAPFKWENLNFGSM
ncbi:Ankyrin repeat-containing protein [Cynara cardunculus var. scolymus]|uniref:Ankyrin repeat-containing protein n=1 Tax=Cynara cardunculus var. scolymus TaxID=59895 RepID=A0A118K4I2_CYNCS|nr:Ankyrin repeat-containing protein [Cynara cardunculus var. scolymus]